MKLLFLFLNVLNALSHGKNAGKKADQIQGLYNMLSCSSLYH